MKIIVLHGDDSEKSYARLTKFIKEAKKRNWEIVNDKLEDTASLFGNEKLIIIRDYKSLGKSEFNLIDRIAGFLVVFHKGVLPATFLKSLPKDTKTEKYDLPVVLWRFLDTWDIKLFHKLLKTNAVEYIFAMIAWKLKQKFIKNPSIQNAKFISELAEIDVKAKTSKVDLRLALELFLFKILTP